MDASSVMSMWCLTEGNRPLIKRATSVERLMLEQKVTSPFRDERLPELLFTDTEICEFR